MKGIKLKIALFALLMLFIPMLSLRIKADVQPKNMNNSIASPSSALKNSDSPGQAEQAFKVLRVSTGNVENIPVSEYVCGVLAAEIPSGFQSEAFKAQAVASFTYACYKREDSIQNPQNAAVLNGAELSDDPAKFEAFLTKEQAKEKWGSSFESRWTALESAVNAVKNKVLVYNSHPIAAVFCSMSSGTTESSKDVWGSDLPYLTEVKSTWDSSAPGFETTVSVSADDFKKKVKQLISQPSFDKDPGKWVTDLQRSNAGGVITAKVCGKGMKGTQIRELFALRSTNFQLSCKDSTFTFTVKGYGHGVGMSQYGANYLASQGKKWDQILTYYYPGVKIIDYQWPK